MKLFELVAKLQGVEDKLWGWDINRITINTEGTVTILLLSVQESEVIRIGSDGS